MTEGSAEKLQEIKNRKEALSGRLNRIQGVKDATETALRAVVEEIKAKGYDPKTLNSVVAEKEAQFEADITAYTEALNKAETAIVAIETSL